MPLNHDTHRTLFISEENIKSEIDNNIDAKKVVASIATAQALYLQPLISTSLYEDLQTKISEDTLNEDEKLLLDVYIRPTLTWFTISELHLFNSFKLTNAGSGRQNPSDNTFQVAELQEIQYLSETSKKRAEQFGERLVKFLQSNKAKYPAYKDGCSGYEGADLPGADTAYQCPIFLG